MKHALRLELIVWSPLGINLLAGRGGPKGRPLETSMFPGMAQLQRVSFWVRGFRDMAATLFEPQSFWGSCSNEHAPKKKLLPFGQGMELCFKQAWQVACFSPHWRHAYSWRTPSGGASRRGNSSCWKECITVQHASKHADLEFQLKQRECTQLSPSQAWHGSL